MTSVRVALGKARWGTHLHLCCKYLRTNTVFHSGSKPLAFTAFLVLKVPKNIANIVVSGDLARQKHRHSQRSVCWMEWQMGKASPYFHFPVVPTIQKNAWYLYYIYIVSWSDKRGEIAWKLMAVGDLKHLPANLQNSLALHGWRALASRVCDVRSSTIIIRYWKLWEVLE